LTKERVSERARRILTEFERRQTQLSNIPASPSPETLRHLRETAVTELDLFEIDIENKINKYQKSENTSKTNANLWIVAHKMGKEFEWYFSLLPDPSHMSEDELVIRLGENKYPVDSITLRRLYEEIRADILNGEYDKALHWPKEAVMGLRIKTHIAARSRVKSS